MQIDCAHKYNLQYSVHSHNWDINYSTRDKLSAYIKEAAGLHVKSFLECLSYFFKYHQISLALII